MLAPGLLEMVSATARDCTIDPGTNGLQIDIFSLETKFIRSIMANTTSRAFVMAALGEVLTFQNITSAVDLFLVRSSSRAKINCGQLISMFFTAYVKESHRTERGSFKWR